MSKEPQNAPPVPDKDRLTGALETLAQVVLGKEFAAIRHEMTEQNTSLFRRVESIREESSRALEQAGTESRTRADELRQEIAVKERESHKATADAEGRLRHAGEELRTEIHKAQTMLDARVSECHQSLTKEIESRDQRIGERLEALTRDLAAVQFELQQLTDSTQRVSAVLGSLAGVLSASPLAALSAAAAPAAGAQRVPVSTAEMENAVDKLFETGA